MSKQLKNVLTFTLILFVHYSYCINLNQQFLQLNNPTFNTMKESEPEKPKELTCDFDIQGPICINSGERILLPSSKPKDILFHLSFDQQYVTDESGNKHFPTGTVKAGPSFTGKGQSGYFSDGTYLTMKDSEDLNAKDFSLTFWIFVLEDYSSGSVENRKCPLFQKGEDSKEKTERAPAVFYDREERRLKIVFSSENKTIGEEELESNSKILTQRWYHIAITKDKEKKVKLFVNGILDNTLELQSKIKHNTSPIYIGNSPFSSNSCKYSFLLDQMRYYKNNLSTDYIQAEASPALGGIAPNFITFGCKDCSIDDAEKICTEGYSLCSSVELHTGGYQIARNLGWLKWDTYIWTKSALNNKGEYNNIKGLGICCKNLD
ncbi:MAG: LamG domain-containing protein [archaeon]|nr:LamG domain-containing protein [archaeon]